MVRYLLFRFRSFMARECLRQLLLGNFLLHSRCHLMCHLLFYCRLGPTENEFMVVVIGFRHKQNNALCIKTKVLLLFTNSLQRCEYLADRPIMMMMSSGNNGSAAVLVVRILAGRLSQQRTDRPPKYTRNPILQQHLPAAIKSVAFCFTHESS